MRKIKLANSDEYALVDNEDYPGLSKYKWYKHPTGYASRTICLGSVVDEVGKRKHTHRSVKMHRVIMNTPVDKDTDHINGNGLDNRRANLRVCDTQQNCFNKRIPNRNTTGFKGVTRITGGSKAKPWQASIFYSGKRIYLGAHKTKVEAARAYNEAAKKYFGEFANLNIIPEKVSNEHQ